MKEKQIVLQPDVKESGVSIIPPEGCEVEKMEIVDGFIVATFKPKERKLPKSLEEFCDKFPVKKGEAFIDEDDQIKEFDYNFVGERSIYDTTILPDRATAEAVIALCQLIQLRNCYNGDWVPDWSDGGQIKYCICFDGTENIKKNWFGISIYSILYFKTEELRDEFLRNFRPLIEKLKPLYGIREEVE